MISLTAVKTSWISAWIDWNRVVRIGAGFGLMRLGPAPSLCARQDGEGPYIEGTGAGRPPGKGDAFCMGEDGGVSFHAASWPGEGTPRCPRARQASH